MRLSIWLYITNSQLCLTVRDVEPKNEIELADALREYSCDIGDNGHLDYKSYVSFILARRAQTSTHHRRMTPPAA